MSIVEGEGDEGKVRRGFPLDFNRHYTIKHAQSVLLSV